MLVALAISCCCGVSGCRSNGSLIRRAHEMTTNRPSFALATEPGTDANDRTNRQELTNRLSPVKSGSRTRPSSTNDKNARDKNVAVVLASFQKESQDGAGPPSAKDKKNTPELLPGDSPTENSEKLSATPSDQVENSSQQFLDPVAGAVPGIGTPSGPIALTEVLDSVTTCYPLISAAIGELESAEGKIIASWGQFDSVFSAYSTSQPLGFYENYRNGTGVSRPLYGGGEIFGGYRIGRGNFEPWYGERPTNDGGELTAGFAVPLVKNRAIDERRANLWSSGFQRDELESNVQSRLIQFQRFSAQAYWEWVAAGQVVEIQRKILELAELRVTQIKKRLAAGDLAQITQLDNDRFIAKRKSEVIKAERKFQQSAIKLSLFYRDLDCQPVIADLDRLPRQTPDMPPLLTDVVTAGVAQAISIRPEISELLALREQICVDLRYAENLTLPKLDVKGYTAQDVGGANSSIKDKSPLVMELGVYAEVPVQRREGAGKIRVAEGKLAQLEAKQQFMREKIRVEVQDAASAVNAAVKNIGQTRLNVELTQRSLELARISFEAGDIDLIELNIYETSVADAGLQLVDAQLEYWSYRASYETAISGAQF